jgi:hypothetical protein
MQRTRVPTAGAQSSKTVCLPSRGLPRLCSCPHLQSRVSPRVLVAAAAVKKKRDDEAKQRDPETSSAGTGAEKTAEVAAVDETSSGTGAAFALAVLAALAAASISELLAVV